MKDFQRHLEKTGEIGYVEKTLHSIVYVAGLPSARPNEVVVFEGGEMGQVLSLTPDYVEVLLLSKTIVGVGVKAARTGRLLQISVGDYLLGKTIDPLGYHEEIGQTPESRSIDIFPPAINARKNISMPFETGVTVVDLVVPLGRGQRELVVGNRKTEKTQFLLQVALTQARAGTVCIYGAVAKRKTDIAMIENFFKEKKVEKSVVIVASSASDPPGLVFITPYTAMTIAEYFRDSGRSVLIILDDLTAHAQYYREITLLARRFPGRSSYPGDIFYVHARLLERAGNFIVKNVKGDKQSLALRDKGDRGEKEVSITCLPVAELVMGDLSGFIQTNLMAMTDGHIYFDRDYYLQGRRPAINTFLSVTRVGHQAQSPLFRDLSRQLTSFLVQQESLRELMHFGAELTEATRRKLSLGDRVLAFFEQSPDITIPANVNAVLLASLWAGKWHESSVDKMRSEMPQIIEAYKTDAKFQVMVDNIIAQAKTFNDLVTSVKQLGRELFSTIAQLPQANA